MNIYILPLQWWNILLMRCMAKQIWEYWYLIHNLHTNYILINNTFIMEYKTENWVIFNNFIKRMMVHYGQSIILVSPSDKLMMPSTPSLGGVKVFLEFGDSLVQSSFGSSPGLSFGTACPSQLIQLTLIRAEVSLQARHFLLKRADFLLSWNGNY